MTDIINPYHGDKIDEGASRYATGHSPQDSHRRNYSYIGYDRLFRLIGKEYKKRSASLAQKTKNSGENSGVSLRNSGKLGRK